MAKPELAHSHINSIITHASDQFLIALRDKKLAFEHPLLVKAQRSLADVNRLRLPNTPETEIRFYGTAVSILAGLIEDEGIDLDEADYIRYPDPAIVLFAELYHLTKRLNFTVLSRPQTGLSIGAPETVMGSMTNYDLIQRKKK